jgi:hypothetical protein
LKIKNSIKKSLANKRFNPFVESGNLLELQRRIDNLYRGGGAFSIWACGGNRKSIFAFDEVAVFGIGDVGELSVSRLEFFQAEPIDLNGVCLWIYEARDGDDFA